MLFAPYRRSQGACLSVHSNRGHCISSRSFDWGHVETKIVATIMSTADMEGRVALQAGGAGAFGRLA